MKAKLRSQDAVLSHKGTPRLSLGTCGPSLTAAQETQEQSRLTRPWALESHRRGPAAAHRLGRDSPRTEPAWAAAANLL